MMPTASPRTSSGVAVFYLNVNLIEEGLLNTLTVLEWLLSVDDRNQPINNLRWVIP